MANGCSAPQFATVVDWALRKACQVSREACNRHDRRYYEGGTLDEKLASDVDLFNDVLHDMLRERESWEDSLGTACAVFRGLQTPVALQHWHMKPTVDRGTQET